MSQELIGLIAKKFIQRRDVKAVQFSSGAYMPDRSLEHIGNHAPLGFKVSHLEAHLAGQASYGHYLLDSDDKARVFAFDFDLDKNKTDEQGNVLEYGGSYCLMPAHASWSPEMTNEQFDSLVQPVLCDPRLVWADRRQQAARDWYKYQMGMLARKFTSVIQKELELPTAAAYTGNKGFHVYGFTGEMPAAEVRAAALLALDVVGDWELFRGKNFYKHKVQDPFMGYPSWTMEIFPKQESLGGKDLGNLLRLPLGRNLKSPDPTFFLDLRTPVAQMMPHPNPVALLETGDPYRDC